MDKLYLDTQVINYLRKSDSSEPTFTFPRVETLLKILKSKEKTLQLNYSAAHLADYLRDPTSRKEEDMKFMSRIGINTYTTYNSIERRSQYTQLEPIEAFYNARLSDEEYKRQYSEIRRPRLDNMLKEIFDWYKHTLKEVEKDHSYLNNFNQRDIHTFEQLREQIGSINSAELTIENFISKIDAYWDSIVFKMSDKDASKFLIKNNMLDGTLISYKNQTFDLKKPSLRNDIRGSQFQKDFAIHMEQTMYSMGLDFSSNYDESVLFTGSYASLQMLGIERDKPKDFNVYSFVNDAAHFYFASFSDILITEDKGFYKKAKLVYALLDVSTRVYNVGDFVSAYNDNKI